MRVNRKVQSYQINGRVDIDFLSWKIDDKSFYLAVLANDRITAYTVANDKFAIKSYLVYMMYALLLILVDISTPTKLIDYYWTEINTRP